MPLNAAPDASTALPPSSSYALGWLGRVSEATSSTSGDDKALVRIVDFLARHDIIED
jgi:hypothetical protein